MLTIKSSDNITSHIDLETYTFKTYDQDGKLLKLGVVTPHTLDLVLDFANACDKWQIKVTNL
jgi:hypothetical protein